MKTKTLRYAQAAGSKGKRKHRRDEVSARSSAAPALGAMTPAGILALQRTIGNAAVNRLLLAQASEGSAIAQQVSAGTASMDRETGSARDDRGSVSIQRLMTYEQFKQYSTKWYFGGRDKVLPIDALLQRYHAEPQNRRDILRALKAAIQAYVGKRKIARLEREVDAEIALLPPPGDTLSAPALGPLGGTATSEAHTHTDSAPTSTPVIDPPVSVVHEATGSDTTSAPIGGTTVDTTPTPVVPEKPYLDRTAAQKALAEAFGDIRTIDAGKVEVLKQAAFHAAYDTIYGATIYSWDAYIAPGPGNLEGFAHEGTNYINEDCLSYDTVPHEMLHSNTAADWRAVVGNQFDEGTTEHLTIAAMEKMGKTPTSSYPDQELCVQAVVAAGVSETSLKTAYLKGGAQTLVADVITANCQYTWAEFKDAMQAQDYARAKTLLVRK